MTKDVVIMSRALNKEKKRIPGIYDFACQESLIAQSGTQIFPLSYVRDITITSFLSISRVAHEKINFISPRQIPCTSSEPPTSLDLDITQLYFFLGLGYIVLILVHCTPFVN